MMMFGLFFFWTLTVSSILVVLHCSGVRFRLSLHDVFTPAVACVLWSVLVKDGRQLILRLLYFGSRVKFWLSLHYVLWLLSRPLVSAEASSWFWSGVLTRRTSSACWPEVRWWWIGPWLPRNDDPTLPRSAGRLCPRDRRCLRRSWTSFRWESRPVSSDDAFW